MNKSVVIPVLLIVSGAIARMGLADSSTVSPQDVFNRRGLTRMGFWLILPAETDLHKGVQSLRSTRAQIRGASLGQGEAEGESRRAEDTLRSLQGQYRDLYDRYSEALDNANQVDKSNVAEYNQAMSVVNSLNQQLEVLLRSIDKQWTDLAALKKSESGLRSLPNEYVRLAIQMQDKAKSAAAAYGKLSRDAELGAAIAWYNRTSQDHVRLGPSGNFQDDLAVVRQCAAELPEVEKSIKPAEQVPPPAASPELLGTMKGDATRRDDDGNIVLADDDKIHTADKFVPPVMLTIVAQTDSTNLRLGYAADQIIFNWEANQDQLRIDGGPANGQHTDGAGRIPVNVWVKVQMIVQPDSMIIFINDRQRFATKADFSHIMENLAIFPANGSVLKVKSVTANLPNF